MILIFIVSFDLYEHVLATSLEKRKTNFLACILDQVYAVIMESAIFYCITKTFCPETLKCLWDGFYWNPCCNRFERRNGRISESKWKPFYWDINHQSRVIPEKYFRFHSNCERMEVEATNSVSLCQIYFPIVIGATDTNLKCFHSELICSVASDYHENNKVKHFLAQNFRLGCLNDF